MNVEEPTAGAANRVRPGRAGRMTVIGLALLLFAAVHTVWTSFHAPLAAWVAPLGAGLLAGGLWSRASGRPLPRWAAALLALAVLLLAALLAWTVVYVLTRQPTTV